MTALTRRGIFGASLALAAPAATAAAPHPFRHPDGELIRLGVELRSAWDACDAYFANGRGMSDETIYAGMAPAEAIVDQIEHIAAHTIEGFQVKALAVAWCMSWDGQHPARLDGINEGGTTAERILEGLLAGLLAEDRA